MTDLVSQSKKRQIPAQTISIKNYFHQPACVTSLRSLLPEGVNVEKFIARTLKSVSLNESLKECTPQSIFLSACTIAENGLQLSSISGEAYLVARKNGKTGNMEASPQIGYKGLQKLATNSGRVKAVFSGTAYENDTFTVDLGDNTISHIPELRKDRGSPLCFYAIAIMENGMKIFKILTVSDARKKAMNALSSKGKFMIKGGKAYSVRWEETDGKKRKSTGKALSEDEITAIIEEDNFYGNNWEAMCEKNASRALCSRLPLSADVIEAIVRDEIIETSPEEVTLEMDLTTSAQREEKEEQATEIITNLFEEESNDSDPKA